VAITLADSSDQFATRVAAVFANMLVDLVKQQDISRTIKKNLFVLLDDVTSTAEVVAAPYWAGFYHEGRGIVVPRDKQVLIWFKDPELDPRKPSNVFRPGRRLTKAEFRFAKDAGLLIITKLARSSFANKHPFFTDAEPELFSRLDPVALAMLNSEVFRLMREEQIRGITAQFTEPAARMKLRL
jgi:hypothetical protein